MTLPFNVLKVGATRKGKTLSAARDIAENPDEAALILDPHKESLAQAVLTYATGNVLYECLSEISLTLGFELLTPSTHSSMMLRQLENQRKAEAFVEILLRRRGADSMAGTPLMEEWIMAALLLFLNQRV